MRGLLGEPIFLLPTVTAKGALVSARRRIAPASPLRLEEADLATAEACLWKTEAGPRKAEASLRKTEAGLGMTEAGLRKTEAGLGMTEAVLRMIEDCLRKI